MRLQKAIFVVGLVALCGCRRTVLVEDLRTSADAGLDAGLDSSAPLPEDGAIPPPPMTASILFNGTSVVNTIAHECTCNPLHPYIPLGLGREIRTCREVCTTLTARAEGGLAPYSYRWNDGETSATRQICSAGPATYEVTATASNMAAASATLQVVPADCCAQVLGEATPDVQTRATAGFGSGTVFTPGAYHVRYLGGCISTDGTSWSINTPNDTHFAVVAGTRMVRVPSTNENYPTAEACREAHRALEPLRLEHLGGQIGVAFITNPLLPREVTTSLRPPTWQLVRCEP